MQEAQRHGTLLHANIVPVWGLVYAEVAGKRQCVGFVMEVGGGRGDLSTHGVRPYCVVLGNAWHQ